MRLFIAINLSDEMRGALIDAQNDMYDSGVRGNYSPEENLHLTLAFIGDFPDPEDVLSALSELEIRPFTITLDRCGSFGGDLWWAGLQASPVLEAIVRRVRRALAENGIPFDRKRFSPHITLIRRAENGFPAEIRPVSMTVDHISLMRSDRGKHGMIYTEVGRCGRLRP